MTGVSRKIKRHFKGVSRMLKGKFPLHFEEVSRKFKKCFNRFSRYFKIFSWVFQESFMGGSRRMVGCFKRILSGFLWNLKAVQRKF